jgi:hypothetical protein
MLDEQVRLGVAAERRDEAREAGRDDGQEAAADDFRAVAPAVMSFGSGRRR